MKYLVVILLILASCTQLELQRVHDETMSNFTYKADVVDHWVKEENVVPYGEEFSGDCEDYATAIKVYLEERDIAAKYIVCKVEGSRYNHMVIEAEGFVVDNRHWYVSKRDDMDCKFVREAVR